MTHKVKDPAAAAAARQISYLYQAADWRAWFVSANELEMAADLVKPQVQQWWTSIGTWKRRDRAKPMLFPPLGCHSIYMMLQGFVVENLCKGALVRDSPSLTFDDSKGRLRIPRDLKTHELHVLIGFVGMQTEEREQELLHRLARAVKWRGRYPVAVEYSDGIHEFTLDNGKRLSSSHIGERDVTRIEDLVARLRAHVNEPRSMTTSRDAAP